jgi:DNA gyrase subunit B
MTSDKKPVYDESAIERLDSIEFMRRRPEIRVGGRDAKALHQIVENAMISGIVAAMDNACKHIAITLLANGSISVTDETEGIPVTRIKDVNGEEGLTNLESSMRVLYIPGNPVKYKINTMPYGGELVVVNALSSQMTAQVRRDGFLWQQRYAAGRPQTSLEQVRPLATDEPTGNTFIFTPDFTIMERNSFDFDLLAARCRDITHTIAGLRMTLRDERVSPAREVVFYAPDGIRARLAEVTSDAGATSEMYYGWGEFEATTHPWVPKHLRVEIAFQYTQSGLLHLESFVNTVASTEGNHIEGFREGLIECLKPYGMRSWKGASRGLSGIINVYHCNLYQEFASDFTVHNSIIKANVVWLLSDILGPYDSDTQKLIDYLKSR